MWGRPMISPVPKPLPPRSVQRFQRRKPLTLITCIRCPESIVLCADAQETVGNHRVAIQKIVPQTMKKFEVVVAGSGSGELVESFITLLDRHVRKRQFGTLKGFVEMAESALAEFYGHDVRLYPATGDPTVKFLIAVVTRSREFNAWATIHVRLQPIDGIELVGWDEPLYKDIAARHYERGMPEREALALSLHLMATAKNTSNYVGGATSAAVISSAGIKIESEEKIQRWETRIAEYQRRTSKDFIR